MLRLMFGWRLKVLVLIIVPPTLLFTLWASQQPAWRRSSGWPGTAGPSPRGR
jgi:hypothetical protein